MALLLRHLLTMTMAISTYFEKSYQGQWTAIARRWRNFYFLLLLMLCHTPGSDQKAGLNFRPKWRSCARLLSTIIGDLRDFQSACFMTQSLTYAIANLTLVLFTCMSISRPRQAII